MTPELANEWRRRRLPIWLALAASPLVATSVGAQEPEASTIEVFRLANGTVLVGRLLSSVDGTVQIDVDGLGSVGVDSAAITSREPAPPPPAAPSAWSGSLSIGASYATAILPGVAETNIGLELTGSVARALSRGAVTLDGSLAYSRIKPAAATTDQWALILGGRQGFAPRLMVLGTSRMDVNHVWALRYRTTSLAGVGFQVLMRPRISLIVAPGLGYVKSEQTDLGRLYSFANGRAPGVDGSAWGFHEMLMIQLAPMLTFQQGATWVRGTQANPQTHLEMDARLTGMVTSHFGLLIVLTRSYDSSIPSPVKNTITILNSGMQLRL
jgi:hypothetical protein